MPQIQLNKVERAILSNQFRILAKLHEDNAEDYLMHAEIAEHGYETLYNELLEHIFEGVPDDIGEETFKILEMFRVINNNYASLSDEERAELDLRRLSFEGFDGNNDPHYGFMEFLINKQDRYEELQGINRNSHSSLTISRYRNMLEVYNSKIGNGKYDLTLDDLKELQETGY